jgi:alpha-D-ribose 1-methylphosphonate 5-phosphate C-P lyase
LKPLDDPFEILFARAEGIHAHGHSAEAYELGVQLATELMIDLSPILTKNGKKKKTNPACYQIS